MANHWGIKWFQINIAIYNINLWEYVIECDYQQLGGEEIDIITITNGWNKHSHSQAMLTDKIKFDKWIFLAYVLRLKIESIQRSWMFEAYMK